ncbi:acyl-coenzyme A thioesterase 1-like isoform X2 [Littorina saxatilis]|uniref:acyl-coenzyme A thioesterase 1-like isoform X2 n=1 Tax=Littorina saxatilis TaxID=31220 RepID=UPI0038B606F2
MVRLQFSAARRLRQLEPILQRCLQQSFSTQPAQSGLIKVTPKVSLFTDKVHIKVQGLPSKAKVTLHAMTEHEWRRKPAQFVSCSHYVARHSGEVDLQKDGSVGGTYTGVEPMGLFWSMQPCPSGPQNIRMVVKNVERPVLYKLSVYLGHLPLSDLHMNNIQHKPLSALEVERVVMPSNVRRIPVKEGTVRGTLFLPPGEGPFPGVIDIFGLAGGLMEIRAALLAANGFAAFALPFFGYDDLPKTFTELTFDYFENTVTWLASHPSVRPGGIGIIAISGGAALGLMMAWKCPQVSAYVLINGPGFHGLMDLYHKGKLLRKGAMLDISRCPVTEEGQVLKDGLMFSEEDFIPLWETDVHLLTLACDDDYLMRPDMGDIHQKLYPEDRRHLIEVVHYLGAGHLLEPPYTPHCRTCFNTVFGQDLLWGGYVKEHAIAQEDSWHRILNFMNKHLPSSS